MSIFKLLFGSPETAVKTAGTIAKGIDSIVYTEQEKADHRAKAMDWLSKYMESTTGQNLARRMLALLVAVEWLLLVNLAVLLMLMGLQEKSDFVFKVLNEFVTEIFMMVMIFYFAAGVITRTFGGDKPPAK